MNIKQLMTAGPKPIWIRYLLLIGFFFLVTRTLLDSQFRHSALLYILVPYLASVFIYIFMPQPEGRYRWQRFGRHILAAIIVMLATSALLFEGFLCVLMFMPIYIFFAIIGFAFAPKEFPPAENPANTFRATFVPLIVIILSLEGVSQTLSFEREYSVTRTKIVSADVAQIKANMAMPMHLDAKRSAFLSLFPLPEYVEAGSLNAGDIHKAGFTYKRWGIANVQRGEIWVKIAEVSDHHVRTEIIKDTSYFSKYMKVDGTLVQFESLSKTETQVTLTIHYTRLLDPAWYFGPMQRAAMGESADYLIDHVIARKDAS